MAATIAARLHGARTQSIRLRRPRTEGEWFQFGSIVMLALMALAFAYIVNSAPGPADIAAVANLPGR